MSQRHKLYCNSVVRRTIDELNAHVVLSGGSSHSPDHWKNMSLGEVLDLITPNRIEFKIVSERVDGSEAMRAPNVNMEDLESGR